MTSLSVSQPPELRPKYWARIAPRSMGDIFFAPVSASQAPRGSLALLGHMSRAPTLPAGILPAWKRAAARHMAISLAPEAPGNLDMLSDAVIQLPLLTYQARANSEHPPQLNGPPQSAHRRSTRTACTGPRGLACPARCISRKQPLLL